MKLRLLVSWNATLLTLLLPVAYAHAAGLEFPDVGTISTGRGGAYAAKPFDGMALTYNPAGFAYQKGLRITVDGKLSLQSVDFQAKGSSKTDKSDNSPFFSPGGVISYGLGPIGPLSGLTFAVGAGGPSSFGRQNFPKDGAQRYELIHSDFVLTYYSAAVAASFGKYLAAGVTMQLAHGSAKFSQATYSGETPGTDPQNDTISKVSITTGVIPTAVIGTTITPTENIAIGLSYRPHFEYSGTGTLNNTLPKAAQDIGAKQIGNDTKLSLNFPDVIRLGVQMQTTTALLLEANVVYEHWSVLDNITITPKNVVIDKGIFGTQQTLSPVKLRKNYQDSFSVRVGGDYKLLEGMLTLRAGYIYESSAISNKFVSVDFANWARHVASVGISVAAGPVFIDAAYAHHFIANQNVTNSSIKQVTTPRLTTTDYAQPSAIGNGKYSADLDVFSLAVRVPFNI